ncbi:ABC transporter substrate-binding protein [Chamaesiphon sp. OTE_8_metabat_110]|uniref:ABC transporter substrate-binding protein n=1 Tax=Chamaesiphon sp. OTE_8_metabat_110 TaxID=2964696 RepID=UPI002869F69B|nr:ABC transporter substrate-binding protein [Chamaesiphon sp. OTE_8_metabat_110]
MSHIWILDLAPEAALDCLSARLRIATIDDETGAISNPHYGGNGTLKIASLINLNRQIIDKFKSATCERKYLGGIKIPDTMIDRVADRLDELRTDVREFQQLLDRTFTQDSWSNIREGLLQSLIGIAPTEPIRLAIITDDYELQSLPIENTTFITNVLGKNNRSVSVVFSPREQQKKLVWKDVPRILLVLGSQKGIEQPIDINEIKKYFPAPAIFELLSHPSREQLLRTISDRVFDIIMIIGHSHANSNGSDGKIHINEDLNENFDGISIQQFTQPFKNSVNKGLKLVILAGCSSIGVARALVSEQIGVPNVIAFRIPVHYQVLRLFFERLLDYWIARAHSLEVALTQTRGELKLYDRDAPGASILPILLTSPWDIPLHFPKKIRLRWQKRILHIAIFHTLLTSKAKRVKVKKLSILGIGLAGTIAWWYIAQPPKLADACNFIQDDSISCGEEILLKAPNIRPREDKQAGANAIANKDYDRAVPLLTKSWDAKQDPETLIMLENAKLKRQNLPIRSIAISIPSSGSTPLDIPTGMLKAVAFAQQQWNADSNHTWKLQVAIVDDRNDKSSAPKLIDNLLNRDILAGIGSYSSEVTSEIKNSYTRNNTVLVSSTSTATELTNLKPGNFFFRVCANNKISGKAIADYLKSHKYTKIALFHTTGKKFSDSMTKALKENLQGISIVEESNFEPTGNAIDVINRAKQAGAQAIVLIPDAYTSEAPERDRLLSLIEANNGDLPIIGNEVVKDQTLFTRFNERQLQKLVISLPWHSSTYRNNTIVEPAFWGNKAQLDHRIAMTYDAAQVVIQALDRVPTDRSPMETRAEIQKIISSNTFSTQGITGDVSFTGSDRYQSINSLVQPLCIQTKCAGFQPAP